MEGIKSYVINLKRRQDRLEELNLPFKYEIFEATDGKKHFTNESLIMQGHYGCLDSHKRLLMKVKDEKLEKVLILEDDVEVCDEFNIKLNEIMGELPEDWDLLYLGGWNLGEIERYSKSLNLAKKVYTTHAYIVRDKFYDTILNKITSENGKVDVLISDILPIGKCFICNPTIAWQREGFSDIVNKITNNIHLR